MVKYKVQLIVRKHLNEYCVLWIQDGVKIDSYTYYTDCKQDAIETKQAIINSYSKTNKTNIVFI